MYVKVVGTLPGEANFLFDSDFTVAFAVNDVVGNTSVVYIHDAHSPTDRIFVVKLKIECALFLLSHARTPAIQSLA